MTRPAKNGKYGAKYGAKPAKRRHAGPPVGTIYKNRNGGYWYRLRNNGKRQDFKLVVPGEKFATKVRANANDLAWNFYREHVENNATDPMAKTVEAFERSEARRSSVPYLKAKVNTVRDFIEWADIAIAGQITTAAVDDYLSRLTTNGMRANSLNNRRGHLSRFCTWLVKTRGALPHNPVADVAPAVVERLDPVYLTREELYRALNVAKEHGIFPEIAFAAYTAMRRSQLIALRWKDVREGPDGQYIVVGSTRRTKSNKPRRIPVSTKLAAVIAEMKRGRPSDHVFEVRTSKEWQALLDPLREHIPTFQQRWQGWHTFRRSLASILLQENESIAKISRILGHQDIRITLQLYGHLVPEHGRDTLEKL